MSVFLDSQNTSQAVLDDPSLWEDQNGIQLLETLDDKT